MNNCPNEIIRDLFAGNQNFLIASHVRPDGDAVGSVLGLGLGLINAGKSVQMVLENGFSSNFKHLDGSEMIGNRVSIEPDIFILVDCSDLSRAGKIVNTFSPQLNIDHHVTNGNFAPYNYVDPEAVATASMIAENFTSWGLTYDPSIASALLTGIITDTLGFRTPNMNASAFRLSAMLMDEGANLSRLYHQGLVYKSFESLIFWGTGLTRLQRIGQLVWTSLKVEDRKQANYPGYDDADLINILSTINEYEIAVLFVEQEENMVKISWRSQPGMDVSRLSSQFGGGGHPCASGAEVEGSLKDVEQKVIEVTLAYMNQRK